MGTILIILGIIILCSKNDNKAKRHHHRSLLGKSNWEKTCDDGGKFFGW